jgi:HEAT repeats
MHKFRRFTCASALFLSASMVFAQPKLEGLNQQLRHSDFRIRVQAALELGRSGSADALDPLLGALDDKNPSVRAAAAAGLRNLHDRRALGRLRAHLGDKSLAVRQQISLALKELVEVIDTSPTPRLLVKLGAMRNGSGVKSAKMESKLADESRRKLGELPGVRVMEEEPARAPRSDLPVVMVTGKIQELKASREGSSIVYTASVEYVLESMPEQTIAAKVSGRASAAASEDDANDSEKSAELRSAVLEAAIASAVRRAPPALLAAARL